MVTKTASGTRLSDVDDELLEVFRQHRVRQAEERLRAGPAWIDHGLVFCRRWGTGRSTTGDLLPPGRGGRSWTLKSTQARRLPRARVRLQKRTSNTGRRRNGCRAPRSSPTTTPFGCGRSTLLSRCMPASPGARGGNWHSTRGRRGERNEREKGPFGDPVTPRGTPGGKNETAPAGVASAVLSGSEGLPDEDSNLEPTG